MNEWQAIGSSECSGMMCRKGVIVQVLAALLIILCLTSCDVTFDEPIVAQPIPSAELAACTGEWFQVEFYGQPSPSLASVVINNKESHLVYNLTNSVNHRGAAFHAKPFKVGDDRFAFVATAGGGGAWRLCKLMLNEDGSELEVFLLNRSWASNAVTRGILEGEIVPEGGVRVHSTTSGIMGICVCTNSEVFPHPIVKCIR